MVGPAPPTFEVVKNEASMASKSFSARMRSRSTDPTMPRQPMNPTFFMCVLFVLSQRLRLRRAHLRGSGGFRALPGYVAGPQSRGERRAHRLLDPRRDV